MHPSYAYTIFILTRNSLHTHSALKYMQEHNVGVGYVRPCVHLCVCVDVCIYQELGVLLPKRKQHTHIPRRLRDTLDRLARPSGIWASDAEKEAIFSFTGYYLYETLHSAMCFGITSISGND